MSEQLVFLHPDSLYFNSYNWSRTDPDEDRELQESIKEHGIVEPIIIRKGKDNKFEIVAGERRVKNAIVVEYFSIPCREMELTDDQALEINLIENLHRKSVSPAQEADGFQQLIKSGKYTRETLANKLSKSVSYIDKRLRLNALIPELRKKLAQNELPAAHALMIARLTPEQQQAIKHSVYTYNGFLKNQKELQEDIERTFHLLMSNSVFPIADENLFKEAGACTTCPKRTGCSFTLFDNVTDKNDSCTDPDCWNKKIDLHLKRTLREAEKDGEILYRLSEQYSGNSETILYQNDFNIVEGKKIPKEAKPGIFSAGPRKGKIVYVIPTKKAATKSTKKDATEEKEEVMTPEARIKNSVTLYIGTLNKKLEDVRDRMELSYFINHLTGAKLFENKAFLLALIEQVGENSPGSDDNYEAYANLFNIPGILYIDQFMKHISKFTVNELQDVLAIMLLNGSCYDLDSDSMMMYKKTHTDVVKFSKAIKFNPDNAEKKIKEEVPDFNDKIGSDFYNEYKKKLKDPVADGIAKDQLIRNMESLMKNFLAPYMKTPEIMPKTKAFETVFIPAADSMTQNVDLYNLWHNAATYIKLYGEYEKIKLFDEKEDKESVRLVSLQQTIRVDNLTAFKLVLDKANLQELKDYKAAWDSLDPEEKKGMCKAHGNLIRSLIAAAEEKPAAKKAPAAKKKQTAKN